MFNNFSFFLQFLVVLILKARNTFFQNIFSNSSLASFHILVNNVHHFQIIIYF
ncbi:MAG: hypothetical protein LBQ24_06445 [Candidatus Peribacteria bacterium]|nr:hypothetical protein [Candidatus Peribacteria bacterium]